MAMTQKPWCMWHGLATEFRYHFKQDIVIDMYCYRRQGHNEGDEPAFTQPQMYAAIAQHPTTRKVYADRLVADGRSLRPSRCSWSMNFEAHLEEDFESRPKLQAEQS